MSKSKLTKINIRAHSQKRKSKVTSHRKKISTIRKIISPRKKSKTISSTG